MKTQICKNIEVQKLKLQTWNINHKYRTRAYNSDTPLFLTYCGLVKSNLPPEMFKMLLR